MQPQIDSAQARMAPAGTVQLIALHAIQDPRQLTYKFGVRYEDASKVPKIAADLKAWFDAHPGVDHQLPAKVSLADLAPYSLTLSVMVGHPVQCH